MYACRARQRQWVRYASRSAVPPLARSCYQDRLGLISGHTVFCFPVLFQRPARQYVVGAIQLFDITYGSPSEYYLRHQGHPICNSFQLAALGCRADEYKPSIEFGFGVKYNRKSAENRYIEAGTRFKYACSGHVRPTLGLCSLCLYAVQSLLVWRRALCPSTARAGI